MGMSGSRRLGPMLENLRHTIAIELLCACQGIDLLAPLKTGTLATKAYETIRAKSAAVTQDRPLAAEIEAVSEIVGEGVLADILR